MQGAREELRKKRPAAGEEGLVFRTAGPSTATLAPSLSLRTAGSGLARKSREKARRQQTERGRGTTRREEEGGVAVGVVR
jgi:hypothetical protein